MARNSQGPIRHDRTVQRRTEAAERAEARAFREAELQAAIKEAALAHPDAG